jgi:hypothetical protein
MKISYDSKSFSMDGQRRLILSGEVHYFRMPKAEWKPVLQQARAAGLNAISTYIPWNYHELAEGKWDFKDDRDLEGFLKICKQVGLLVIARPGPYICAEWNFGGFPSWLHSKGIKHYRTSDTSYLAPVDAYLEKVLGILSRHQVNRGGPVFLVQIENEFDYAPQDPAYLRHLENKFKKKLSIPLFFGLGDTRRGGGAVPGAMLAANYFDDGRVHLENLRRLAAGTRQPMLVSEFWTGWFAGWGKPAAPKPAEVVENRLVETLASGAALINQYMFFGGSNFDGHAGRQVGSEKYFCTTSYDYDAPLSEGGEVTPKSLRLGLWARRAACLEEFLLGAEVETGEQPVVPSETGLTVRVKGDSRFLFLHNPTNQEIKGKAQYEDTVPFTLAPGERKFLPFNIEVTPSLALRACTHPYVFFRLGNRLLVVLWGEAGEKLSLWGTGTLDVTEKTSEGLHLEHERKGFVLSAQVQDRPQKLLAKILFESAKSEVLFLIVNRRLAERLHSNPDQPEVVLGPQTVDFDQRKAHMEPGSQTLLSAKPSAFEETFLTAETRPVKTAALSGFSLLGEASLLKHLAGRQDWKPGRVGADLAEYGFQNQRAWFRLKFQAASKGRKNLIFPGLEDKFSVFHKGKYLGLYGRQGKGARLELNVDQGQNELLLMVEDCGRYNFGTKLGEKKGLLLPVYDGGEVQPYIEGWHFLAAGGPLDLKIFSSPTFVGRGWETASLPKVLERTDYVCARKKFTVPSWVKRVRLNLHAGNISMQVALNGQLVDQHPDFTGAGYKEIELTPNLISGENTVALFFKGPTQGFEKSEMLFLGSELPLQMEVCEGLYGPEEMDVLKDKGWAKGGKAAFGFWRASFKSVVSKDLSSAWLTLKGNGRGSVWLNGHDLGRHWKIGPQTQYKLPLSWLKPVNDLVVFEEEAGLPQGGDVQFRFKLHDVKLP